MLDEMDNNNADVANTVEKNIALNVGNNNLGSNSKESLQPKRTAKNMMFLSFSLYCTFFCLGLVAGLPAPALLHLVELYETDVSRMSVMFTFASIGYLLGACLCSLLFDRTSHELQHFLLNLLMACFTVLIPLLPGLYFLFAVAFLQNVAAGYIDASGQSYIIRLWENHKLKEPLMIGMHAIWSVGAFTSPFVVLPFMVDLPQRAELSNPFNGTSVCNMSVLQNITVSEEDIPGLDRIKYPYIITGCVVVVSSFFCLTSYCLYTNHGLPRAEKIKEHQEPKSGEALSFKLPMLFMQFLFFFLYSWYELIPGALLSTFVIEGLKWTIHDGAILLSVYWGSHGIGRIVNIPISFFMKSFPMLSINAVICVVGHTIMLIAVFTNDKLLWVSTAMSGFSMGALFSVSILWVSQYMHITGAIGSFFLIAFSIGSMTGPALAGFLYEYYSHMWVVYLSFMASVTQGIVFLLMFVFVKIHRRRIKCNKTEALQGEREPMHTTDK